MHSRHVITAWLALSGLVAAAETRPTSAPATTTSTQPASAPASRPAAPSFDLGGEGGPAELEVRVVTRPEKLSDLPREYGRIHRTMQDMPPGAKVRVSIRKVFNPSRGGIVPTVAAFVPLDDEGRPHGQERHYHPWGRMLRTVPFVHGARHGVERVYDRRGRKSYVREEIPWTDGRVHGVKKTYHPDGTIRSASHYRRGKAHGASRAFDEKGRLLALTEFENGQRHGKAVKYWPDKGEPRRVATYDRGDVTGVLREYYASGALKRELPFKENARHGVEKQYDPDGAVIRTRTWSQGELVSEKAGP